MSSSYIPIHEQKEQQKKEKTIHANSFGRLALGDAFIHENNPKKRKIISKEGLSIPPMLNLFPDLLHKIIDDYKKTLEFTFRKWIPYQQIELAWLCANTNITAIQILTDACRIRGPDYLDWKVLCRNPNALSLIEQYPNLIEYDELAYNSSAYELLLKEKEKHPENFHWGNFSANSKAKTYITDKSFDEAGMNIEQFVLLHEAEKLNWANVSANRSSYILDFLFNTVPFRVNMGVLSGNPHPIAITELEKRLKFEESLTPADIEALPYEQKIDWFLLSGNYAATHLLAANIDKIRWDTIGENENAKDLIKNRIKVEDEYEKEEKEQERQEHIREKRIREIMVQLKKPSKRSRLHLPVDMDNIKKLSNELETLKSVKRGVKKDANNRLNWCLICANRKLLNLVKEEYERNPNKIISRLPYLAANPSIFVLNKGSPPIPSESPTKFKTSSNKLEK